MTPEEFAEACLPEKNWPDSIDPWKSRRLAIAKMVKERDTLMMEVLIDVVNQACRRDDGLVDSMALPSYAAAMGLLEEQGKLKILHEYGRRVIGRWK